MRRIIHALFCSHNVKLLSRLKNVDVAGCNVGGKGALLPTQQFGASLEWIREHQVPCSCNLGPELGYNVLIAPSISARELQWHSAYNAQVHRLSQSAGLPRDRGHLSTVGKCCADQGAAGM